MEADYSQSKAECSKTKQEFEEMKLQAAVAIERINEDIPDQRLSKPLLSLGFCFEYSSASIMDDFFYEFELGLYMVDGK